MFQAGTDTEGMLYDLRRSISGDIPGEKCGESWVENHEQKLREVMEIRKRELD